MSKTVTDSANVALLKHQGLIKDEPLTKAESKDFKVGDKVIARFNTHQENPGTVKEIHPKGHISVHHEHLSDESNPVLYHPKNVRHAE